MTVLIVASKQGNNAWEKIENFAQQKDMTINFYSTETGDSEYDAVIIDALDQTAEGTLVLLHALALKKPIIYCAPKNKVLPEAIQMIARHQDYKKFFSLIFCTPESMAVKIQRFIEALAQGDYEEYPAKFTVRLSIKLLNFLDQRSEATGQPKAEVIRQLLETAWNQQKERSV